MIIIIIIIQFNRVTSVEPLGRLNPFIEKKQYKNKNYQKKIFLSL